MPFAGILKERKTPSRGNAWFRIIAKYSALFLLFSFIAFFPFFWYRKAFLWGTDGINQHIQSLRYTRDWIMSLPQNGPQFWDLTLGFGESVFGNSLHFRILNFFYCLFGDEHVELFLVFRTLAYVYCSGIAFIVFIKNKTTSEDALLIGALSYSFSAYTLYFAARHAFFIEMMVFFPLQCAGIDRMFKNGRSLLLIAVVCVTSISYVYFLLMTALPTVAYAAILFFSDYDERYSFISLFVRGVLHYCAGLALAAFSVLPQVLAILNSSRVGGADIGNLLFWGVDYYAELFLGIIGLNEFGIYGFVSLSAPGLYAVLFALFDRENDTRVALRNIGLCLFALLVPFITMAFSGFSGKTLRWVYLIPFWVSVALSVSYDAFVSAGKSRIARRGSGVLLITSLAALVSLILTIVVGKKPSLSLFELLAGMALLSAVMLNSWAVNREKMVSFTMLLLLATHLAMNSFEMYSPKWLNYIDSFVDAGTVSLVAKDNAASSISDLSDSDQYRTDLAYFTRSELYDQLNYGLSDGVNGVSSYYSYSSKDVYSFSRDMANSQLENPFLITGWSQRTVLNELSSVKYLAARKDDRLRVPYGYRLLSTLQYKSLEDGDVESQVFVNEMPLPLMYAYQYSLDPNEYEQLAPYDREWALLQGIYLEDQSALPQAKVNFNSSIVVSDSEIRNQMRASGIDVYEDHIHIDASGTTVTIPFESTLSGELYFFMRDVSYVPTIVQRSRSSLRDILLMIRGGDSGITAASVTASSNGKSDSTILLAPEQQYYYGDKDAILNTGFDETFSSIEITFWQPGDYFFSDSSVVLQRFDGYEERVATLLDEPVTNITLGADSIGGDIHCDATSAVCVAVPFSSGWSATVNGSPADLHRANGMFMAVVCSPGDNHIELTYSLPGLRVGIIVSTAACGAMSLLYILFSIRAKRGSLECRADDVCDAVEEDGRVKEGGLAFAQTKRLANDAESDDLGIGSGKHYRRR